MKRYLPLIIVAVVAIATLGSGAMLYRAKLPHPLTIPEDKSVSREGDAESMHVRGNANAQVTLEEFGDFQCPPCGSISGFLDELVKEYNPHLRIVFALAAEAAGLQGRFWEMHDVLYREQATWSKADNPRELFDSYAGMIGLNVDQFKKDMEGEKARARVDSDQERANSLGVNVTPEVFINDHQMAPADKTPEGLRAAIDAALKEKS